MPLSGWPSNARPSEFIATFAPGPTVAGEFRHFRLPRNLRVIRIQVSVLDTGNLFNAVFGFGPLSEDRNTWFHRVTASNFAAQNYNYQWVYPLAPYDYFNAFCINNWGLETTIEIGMVRDESHW